MKLECTGCGIKFIIDLVQPLEINCCPLCGAGRKFLQAEPREYEFCESCFKTVPSFESQRCDSETACNNLVCTNCRICLMCRSYQPVAHGDPPRVEE